MKREKQMEILDGAEARAEARLNAWHSDPKIRARIRSDYEQVKKMKADADRKRKA